MIVRGAEYITNPRAAPRTPRIVLLVSRSFTRPTTTPVIRINPDAIAMNNFNIFICTHTAPKENIRLVQSYKLHYFQYCNTIPGLMEQSQGTTLLIVNILEESKLLSTTRFRLSSLQIMTGNFLVVTI
jgi:hypothetical protein